jgi:hypothetical protein
MAETTTQTDWHAIVKARWRGASINGDGEWAVVRRCKNITEVFLFSKHAEAAKLRDAFCDADSCLKRHSLGSLVPFVPAPPPVKSYRWNSERQRD